MRTPSGDPAARAVIAILVALALTVVTACGDDGGRATPEATDPPDVVDGAESTEGSGPPGATVPNDELPGDGLPGDGLPSVREVHDAVERQLPERAVVEWAPTHLPNCGPVDEVLPGRRLNGSATLTPPDDGAGPALDALAAELRGRGIEVTDGPEHGYHLEADLWWATLQPLEGPDANGDALIEVRTLVDGETIPDRFGPPDEDEPHLRYCG